MRQLPGEDGRWSQAMILRRVPMVALWMFACWFSFVAGVIAGRAGAL
jgi:hypothetical protein